MFHVSSFRLKVAGWGEGSWYNTRMTDHSQRLIDLAVEIQQVAAPTFHEQQRAEFVRRLFEREGLSDVSIDAVGNVYGRFQVSGLQAKPLIISAHLDTVFPFEMDLTVKRDADKVHGIGIGDNSLGVAALLGLVWSLRERLPSHPTPLRQGEGKRDIWLVANTCEEGLGDLRGMKAVVERFGGDVTAYLVLEGMALGHIYHRAVGVKRYKLSVRTKGGHSWSDYGLPSAIHELSKLVVELTTLALPKEPRTTMNVGRIGGGTSINVIAPEAWLELDLRSEGQAALEKLIASVEKVIRAANKPGVSVEAEVIGQRPAGELSLAHPLVRLAEESIRAVGLEPMLTTGSTDANIPLSKGFPALVLGVTTGGNAHTKAEFVNTEPVGRGLEQLARFVERVVGG